MQKKTVSNIVACSVGDSVVGVEVKSRAITLPRVEDGPVSSPNIPRCFDRHIFLTEDQVVTVEVMARVKIYPRQMKIEAIREVARETFVTEENREPDAEGLEMLAQRLARKMLQRGVVVK